MGSLLALAVLLFFLDATVNHAHWIERNSIRRLFNMTREDGLGSWVTISVTLLTALTAWGIVGVERRLSSRRALRIGWVGVALYFSWMAVDDGAQLHERLGTTFREVREAAVAEGAEPGPFERFPSYAWQFAILPILGTAGVVVMGFLWRVLPRRRRRLVPIALACFVFAVALDFVEGLERDHPWNVYAWVGREADFDSLAFRWFHEPTFDVLDHFSRTLEESTELVGITLLWAALLYHLGDRAGDVRIRALAPATRETPSGV